MSSRPHPGQKGYHRYLVGKYRGNSEKLIKELEYWGITPSTGRGCFNNNIWKLHDFKNRNPYEEWSYEDLANSHFDLSAMDMMGKRNFAHNFKKFSSFLPEGVGMRVKLITEDPVTGQAKKDGKWTTFSASGLTPDAFMRMLEKHGTFTYRLVKDQTHETPFTEFTEETVKIIGIEIETYNQAKPKPKTRQKRGGKAFPFMLIDDTFDLSKYQIYSSYEDIDRTPCFLYALKMSGLIQPSVLASIEKDIDGLERIEFTAVKMIAVKYKLNIIITQVYVQADKTIESSSYSCLFGSSESPIIRIGCMFGHYFLNEEIRLNTSYYRLRDDPRLDLKRKELVQRTSGKYLRYFKSADELPFKHVYQHLAEMNRLNAFIPLDKSKLKSKKENKVRSYSFEAINPNDFQEYKFEGEWTPGKIFSKMKGLYRISGNIYNIVKNSERAGKYLFNGSQHITERLVCLDVRSMYPFVICLIGVQLGLAEIIKSKEEIFGYSSAFILIRITSIGKRRKFDVIENLQPGDYFVRLIELRDLIEFNQIEYEFIGGIGWKGPRDFSLNEYIAEIYAKKENAKTNEERLKYKDMLNKELYGYSLVKPKTTYPKVLTDAQLKKILNTNFDKYVSDIEREDGLHDCILRKRMTNSYNMANFGVEISGYARHILHEYIYKCEDNGIEVFFGFTDSFYIRESDLERFERLFPGTIGPKMGQLKIEKRIDEAYFLKKSIYALKLTNGSFIESATASRSGCIYIYSVPEDRHKIRIFNKTYGDGAYFKRFESFMEKGKFKCIDKWGVHVLRFIVKMLVSKLKDFKLM